MTRITRDQAKGALASAQKPQAGVPAYLRWVNRPLGGQVAVTGAALGASPNQLTAISAALGAIGVVVLACTSITATGLIAAVLLLAGYIFDSADGQLARIQKRGGPAGEWLDHVVDGVRAPLVHIAVAVHLYLTGAPMWVAVVALLFSVLVSAWFLSQLLAEKLLPKQSAATAEGARHGVLESFVKQPQDPSTTYVILVLLPLPIVFSIAYTLLAAWHLLIFAASLTRKYRQLRSL